MKYSESDIEKVKASADIRDFVPGLTGRGATQYASCPQCQASGKNKGLCVTHKGNKDIAKCFSCGFSLNGALDACMHFEKVKFPEAVKIVAERYGILIESEEEKRHRSIESIKKKTKNIFIQLKL